MPPSPPEHSGPLPSGSDEANEPPAAGPAREAGGPRPWSKERLKWSLLTALSTLPVIVAYYAVSDRLQGKGLAGLMLLLGLVVFPGTALVWEVNRRRLAARWEEEGAALVAWTGGPPGWLADSPYWLYLRGFDHEVSVTEEEVGPSWPGMFGIGSELPIHRVIEKRLARLAGSGRAVVTLRNPLLPGSGRTVPGITPIAVDGERWMEAVAQLARGAECVVVVVADPTPGLILELEELARGADRDKTLLVLDEMFLTPIRQQQEWARQGMALDSPWRSDEEKAQYQDASRHRWARGLAAQGHFSHRHRKAGLPPAGDKAASSLFVAGSLIFVVANWLGWPSLRTISLGALGAGVALRVLGWVLEGVRFRRLLVAAGARVAKGRFLAALRRLPGRMNDWLLMNLHGKSYGLLMMAVALIVVATSSIAIDWLIERPNKCQNRLSSMQQFLEETSEDLARYNHDAELLPSYVFAATWLPREELEQSAKLRKLDLDWSGKRAIALPGTPPGMDSDLNHIRAVQRLAVWTSQSYQGVGPDKAALAPYIEAVEAWYEGWEQHLYSRARARHLGYLSLQARSPRERRQLISILIMGFGPRIAKIEKAFDPRSTFFAIQETAEVLRTPGAFPKEPSYLAHRLADGWLPQPQRQWPNEQVEQHW